MANKDLEGIRQRIGNVLALLAQQCDSSAEFASLVDQALVWVEDASREGANVGTTAGRLTVALADHLERLRTGLKGAWSEESTELRLGLAELYAGVREPLEVDL